MSRREDASLLGALVGIAPLLAPSGKPATVEALERAHVAHVQAIRAWADAVAGLHVSIAGYWRRLEAGEPWTSDPARERAAWAVLLAERDAAAEVEIARRAVERIRRRLEERAGEPDPPAQPAAEPLKPPEGP